MANYIAREQALHIAGVAVPPPGWHAGVTRAAQNWGLRT